MRLLNFLAEQKWAITEECLRHMESIYLAHLARKANGERFDKEALEKELGKPLDNTRTVTIRNGVATIPIEGPIFRYADFFSEISGATTYETLAKDFGGAMADPQVKDVVLYVNSPGGQVDGCNEFSNMIFEARDKGKRIIAYVSNEAASAAYWIASAADEVVIDDTATVGCIGVILGVGSDSQDGKTKRFISSQTPHKRPDPNKEKGADQIQTVADDLCQVFLDTVARNRGLTPAKAEEDFCAQWLYVGQKAVEAGLADRIGSYESVLEELQGDASSVRTPSKTNSRASNSDNGGKTMADENKDKGWFGRFLASLSGDERKEVIAELNGSGGGMPNNPNPTQQPQNLDSETLRKAQAFDKLQKDMRAEQAATFATEQVTKHKTLLTFGKDKLQGLFAQLTEDDATSPLAQGTRVEQLQAVFTALPGHHLTAEQAAGIVPDGATVLENDSDPDNKLIEAGRESARKFGEKANAAGTNGKH
jgi:ClpP class serine protease